MSRIDRALRKLKIMWGVSLERFFDNLAGKKVGFIGGGVAHRDLLPMFAHAGARVTLCDRRPLSEFGSFGDELLSLGIRLSLGENYLDGLQGQDMILRTPGFEYYTPELQAAGKAGAQLTSEIELFFEHCPARIIGITGSDGKTTTSSLIAAILSKDGRKVHLGGNIGRAMLPMVDTVKPDDMVVVELSSFQLISMDASPDIAVVTNVTPNHLDHHNTMEEYIDAKRNCLLYQKQDGIAVLGYENEITHSMEKDVVGHLRWFSRLNPVYDGAFLDKNGMLCTVENGTALPIVSKQDVKLRGEHNIENLLAAFAALRDEVSPSSMEAVAKEFGGVEHRIELVRTVNGVQWFNDSIATSPTRVVAGLRAFEQKLSVIAGGYDKNIPFAPMAKDLVERAKMLILMGPAAQKIEDAVRAEEGFTASGLAIYHAENMEDAVEKASQYTLPGDIVTLSPACASFDSYANFEDRGNHYKSLVDKL